jgi:hypothetical protein
MTHPGFKIFHDAKRCEEAFQESHPAEGAASVVYKPLPSNSIKKKKRTKLL